MDIEKPQPVEILAKELKEHGIACSLDEAQQKAQAMIMATENKKQESEELQLLEQRYKFLLNSQNQKFSEEINALKNTLSSISSELANLKRKFNEQKQEIKINQEEEKPKTEVQQKITEAKEEKKETPVEELKPEDISIEKFFYFGKK